MDEKEADVCRSNRTILMMTACSDETNEPIQNEEAVDIEPEPEQQEDLENEDTEMEEIKIEDADHSESEQEDGPIHDEMFLMLLFFFTQM